MKNNLELLNTDLIKNHIKSLIPESSEKCDLEVLTSVTSTNDYLLDLIKNKKKMPPNYVILAEEQTAGRGRMGKKWESPFSNNLYLSFYHNFTDGYETISGLSLVTGVVIARALQEVGLKEVLLKWPNDIYCKNKKLCGFLIETNRELDGSINTVIGIGINVNSAVIIEDKIDQPCTDIASNLDSVISRNFLAAMVIKEIMVAIEKVKLQGISCFISDWNKLDWLQGKELEVTVGDKKYIGLANGINTKGELCLSCEGKSKYFNVASIKVLR